MTLTRRLHATYVKKINGLVSHGELIISISGQLVELWEDSTR